MRSKRIGNNPLPDVGRALPDPLPDPNKVERRGEEWRRKREPRKRRGIVGTDNVRKGKQREKREKRREQQHGWRRLTGKLGM